jgi:acyl-CoA oxidase
MIIQQTWEGDNNVLLQQTGKYLLDIFKNKMKGKQTKATTTCEWVKTDPVLGQKCTAQTLDELLSFDSLMATFEFRANFLLQKSAMELSNRVMGESKEHPLDAWNAV